MEKKHECCTPKGQVPRYVDCVGCDKKPIEGATLSYAQAQKDSFNIMEKKQSSVDWYENKLIQLDIDFGGHKNYWIERKKLRDQVKQMEKQQIGDAYRRGFISDDIKLADDYYNETFGGYTGVIVFDNIRLTNTSGTNHLSHINPLTDKITNGGSNE